MSQQHGPIVADLNVAGQFVVWALRTRLEGAAKLDRLEEGFRLAQGGMTGGAALAAFETWFAILANHCGRDLYLHRTPALVCVATSGRWWIWSRARKPVTRRAFIASPRRWSTRARSVFC